MLIDDVNSIDDDNISLSSCSNDDDFKDGGRLSYAEIQKSLSYEEFKKRIAANGYSPAAGLLLELSNTK
jgi:hypothetical protein